MLDACALDVTTISEHLRVMTAAIPNRGYQGNLTGQGQEDVLKFTRTIKEAAVRMGATATVIAIDTLHQMVERGPSWRSYDQQLQNTAITFHREMGYFHCLLMDGREAREYNATASDIFGAGTLCAFPSADYDLTESLKCAAVKRPTASVFHLMRVAELVAESMAVSLGHVKDPAQSNTLGIGAYVKHVKSVIGGGTTAASHWPASKSWYVETHASFEAIKDAWRNGTMHLEKTYTEGQAEGIRAVVKAILSKASERLDENGTYTP